MSNHYVYRQGWGALLVTWAMTMVIYSWFLLSNVLLGVIVGAFAALLLSYIPPGSWIIDGLRLFGIDVSVDDFYKIAAAIGFVSGFLKFSVSPGRLMSQKNNFS